MRGHRQRAAVTNYLRNLNDGDEDFMCRVVQLVLLDFSREALYTEGDVAHATSLAQSREEASA